MEDFFFASPCPPRTALSPCGGVAVPTEHGGYRRLTWVHTVDWIVVGGGEGKLEAEL